MEKLSNPGFRGTFVLNPKSQKIREMVPDIVKKHRQIFHNIKNEGDIVIVTRNNKDRHIKDFINSEKIDFEYYPEISTKSGLDDGIPEGLKKIIGIKNNCVIKSLGLLNKFFSENQIHLSKQSEYLHETLNTLRLNIENPRITINDRGIFVIRDDAKQRTIKSTEFLSGNAYVYILPDSINQEIKRFLIGSNGKQIVKEYSTPKDIRTFNKAFNKIADGN